MKVLFSVLILFLAHIVKAQYFEGTLTNVVEMELGEILKGTKSSEAELMEQLKNNGWSDTIKVYYKGANYASISNNTYLQKTIYRADSNKRYAIWRDSCIVINEAIDIEQHYSGKAPKISKIDTTVDINGKTCSLVRVKWSNSYIDYFYEENTYPVNASLFSKSKADGWAAYLKIAKVLPIRIVKVSREMIVTSTVVSSKAHKVDAAIFIVPKLEELPT